MQVIHTPHWAHMLTHPFNFALLTSVCTRLGNTLSINCWQIHHSGQKDGGLLRDRGKPTQSNSKWLIGPRDCPLRRRVKVDNRHLQGLKREGHRRMNGRCHGWCLLCFPWYQIPRQQRPALHPFPLSLSQLTEHHSNWPQTTTKESSFGNVN